MGLPVRKVVVGAVGLVVLLAGIALLVLPGPGILVVILGLSILATEFPAARRAKLAAQRQYQQARARLRQRRLERRSAARSEQR